VPLLSRQDGVMHDLDRVRSALRDREPVFHRPERGTDRADWERMTVPDYWEVGASGAIYDRAFILDSLADRYADPAYDPMAGLAVDDFAVREAGSGVWLATYRLCQGERLTRRVSVWREAHLGWQLLYHQGTVITTTGD
jgi:hypothetical protein